MKEALFFERLEKSRVRCGLCAHRCLIPSGETGLCGVRLNQDGTLMSLVYGRAISANLDPIEKKPLFHFLPGSTSFSVATAGCNMSCAHCQNYGISQISKQPGPIPGTELSPEELVRRALGSRAASISYTYTEPTIYFEYALDTARLATRAGLRNVFVTNGYMTAEALETIGSDLHAANVDLKGFTDNFYKKVCGARLKPVKDTIVRMRKQGVWVEVTTLVIPGYNDDPEELTALAQWLVGVDPDLPWHISSFRPTYRLTDAPPTPTATIHRARDIGLAAGLKYVYSGNVWGDEGEKTSCHSCGRMLIDRVGFTVKANHLRQGACPHCGAAAAGVWA